MKREWELIFKICKFGAENFYIEIVKILNNKTILNFDLTTSRASFLQPGMVVFI